MVTVMVTVIVVLINFPIESFTPHPIRVTGQSDKVDMVRVT